VGRQTLLNQSINQLSSVYSDFVLHKLQHNIFEERTCKRTAIRQLDVIYREAPKTNLVNKSAMPLMINNS